MVTRDSDSGYFLPQLVNLKGKRVSFQAGLCIHNIQLFLQVKHFAQSNKSTVLSKITEIMKNCENYIIFTISLFLK